MGTSLDPLLFWKPSQSLGGALRFGASSLASLLRLGAGSYVVALGPRPERRLVLYSLEACPFSRKVREALSMLDIDVDVRPCPKGGTRFRDELEELRVPVRLPTLVDPNNAAVLQESDAIVDYLFRTYGDGPPPLALRLKPLATTTSMLASYVRGAHGAKARRSKRPERELELWSYEASPYCRFVREVLEEYELPYVVHNLARNSPRRAEFETKKGKLLFPYFEDPNTNAMLFQSAAIIDYLRRTYGEDDAAEEARAEERERSSRPPHTGRSRAAGANGAPKVAQA